jgi:phospholipase/carboxylesterase
MTEDILEAVVLPARGTAHAAVVWLHGLGADGHDFVPVIEYLRLQEHGVRVILPHAPRRPVTLNLGYVMRAWYDVRDRDLRHHEDAEGIREATHQIHALLSAEIGAGIPAERVVLAGFSQGGALALHAGLRYPERLAGIVALSAYLPLPESLPEEAEAANRGAMIFMGHGEADPIIPIEAGQAAFTRLRESGYLPRFERYPMEHAVSQAEVDAVGAWIEERLL